MAIRELGLTPFHRRSFLALQRTLAGDQLGLFDDPEACRELSDELTDELSPDLVPGDGRRRPSISSEPRHEAVKAILDCDPGHDDVMAILLAGRTLDLRAITTVHGNASLANTTTNARKTVEFAGLTDIPIAAGMPRPLVREPHYAPDVHGESGSTARRIPPPTVAVLDQHAVDLIIERSHSVPDLHLVPVGPLTNIASALIKDPTLPTRIREITLMGGSLTFGNVTPAAEFNIWCDPEAAHVVFTSGIPIRMIGLNVTRQVLATPDYRAPDPRDGPRVHDARRRHARPLQRTPRPSTPAWPAARCTTRWRSPRSRTRTSSTFEPMHVAVELSGTHTAGMTLCDGRRLGPDMRGDPDVEAAGARARRPTPRSRWPWTRAVLGAVPRRPRDVPIGAQNAARWWRIRGGPGRRRRPAPRRSRSNRSGSRGSGSPSANVPRSSRPYAADRTRVRFR